MLVCVAKYCKSHFVKKRRLEARLISTNQNNTVLTKISPIKILKLL